MKRFRESVYSVTKKIPRGKVTTYKILARAIRKPRAYRVVGNALNSNPDAPKVPCHRVVRSDGNLGGYAKGVGEKIKLLRREGVEIRGGRVQLKKFGITL